MEKLTLPLARWANKKDFQHTSGCQGLHTGCQPIVSLYIIYACVVSHINRFCIKHPNCLLSGTCLTEELSTVELCVNSSTLNNSSQVYINRSRKIIGWEGRKSFGEFSIINYYTLHNILLYKSNKTIWMFYTKSVDVGDNASIYNVEGNNRLSPGMQPLTTRSVLKILFISSPCQRQCELFHHLRFKKIGQSETRIACGNHVC
jgi:hypothetical protein